MSEVDLCLHVSRTPRCLHCVQVLLPVIVGPSFDENSADPDKKTSMLITCVSSSKFCLFIHKIIEMSALTSSPPAAVGVRVTEAGLSTAANVSAQAVRK